MAKTITSFSELKTILLKELYDAATETIDKSYDDLVSHAEDYENSPTGTYYVRTHRLAEAPRNDGISGKGNLIIGQISIDTDYVYEPHGRDTPWIYTEANATNLAGNVPFWDFTLEDFEKNKNMIFGKRF